MAVVDPDDDDLMRWVVMHYRFDPVRRQRRNMIVAAYDNQAEFDEELDACDSRIRSGIESGDLDPQERVSGAIWEPGYRAAQARGRLARDAVAHGVDPRRLLDAGRLPSNVTFFGWDADGQPWAISGDAPPAPTVH